MAECFHATTRTRQLSTQAHVINVNYGGRIVEMSLLFKRISGETNATLRGHLSGGRKLLSAARPQPLRAS